MLFLYLTSILKCISLKAFEKWVRQSNGNLGSFTRRTEYMSFSIFYCLLVGGFIVLSGYISMRKMMGTFWSKEVVDPRLLIRRYLKDTTYKYIFFSVSNSGAYTIIYILL